MDSPRLSTMVVLYYLNLKLNTNELLERIPLNEDIIKVEKRGVMKRGESSRDKIRRRSKKDEKVSTTGFGHNSITVVMMNDGNGTLPMKEITVKIFQNGVFHMTGILHPDYDKYSLEKLVYYIWDECHDCLIEPPESYEILRRRVVLMNYTSELNPKSTVAREPLYNAIRANGNLNITASYDPDVYPGVKIKFSDSKWTAKIFRTGKIILTGITTHEDCMRFVDELNSLFKKTLLKK